MRVLDDGFLMVFIEKNTGVVSLGFGKKRITGLPSIFFLIIYWFNYTYFFLNKVSIETSYSYFTITRYIFFFS